MIAEDSRLGTHLLIEGSGASSDVLDDPIRVRQALEATVKAGGLTLLRYELERFVPQGITAVGLLAESHLVIHTWPERGAFAADLFHCGELPRAAAEDLARVLATRLEAARWRHTLLDRMAPPPADEHASRATARPISTLP